MITRGDIYYADLSPTVGSEQGGIRPVLIIQNDIGNSAAPTTIIAPMTTNSSHNYLPTHIPITVVESPETGLKYTSTVMLEQVRTIDRKRLIMSKRVGRLSDQVMDKIDNAIKVSLGLARA